MTPIVNSIHCNFLPVKNLKKSINWYSRSFGFKLLWIHQGYASCCLDPLGTKLTLVETVETNPAVFMRNGKAHPIVTLGTTDIRNTYKHLQQLEVIVTPITFYKDGHVCFVAEDPNHNLIQVCNVNPNANLIESNNENP